MSDLDRTPLGSLETPDSLAWSALVGQALLRATDITTDAWAVFRAVRDDGHVVDARLLYGNDAYWAMTGFDPATSIGRTLGELIPTLDWTDGVAALTRQVLETGEPLIDRHARSALQSGPRAGEEGVFELEFSAADDLLSVGFRDITREVVAREHQEADAARSAAVAAFLTAAVDGTLERSDLLTHLAELVAQTVGERCAILDHRPDGTITIAAIGGTPDPMTGSMRSLIGERVGRAAALASQLGVGRSIFLPTIPAETRSAIGSSMVDLGIEPGSAAITGLLAAPIVRGDTLTGSVVVLRMDTHAPFSRDDLQTVEVLATAASLIFERRAAEAGQAAFLARFEALFDQAPIPMVFGSEDGIRFNDAACTLFARDRDDLIRHALQVDSPWIPVDERDAWRAMRQSFITREAAQAIAFAIVRPDGERRQVEATAIPLTGPDLRSAGVVAVLTDLTDRQSLEAQLRHAQKMEALGRLAGGIAHDFNNVLMAILGYAEFVAADIRRGAPSVDDADQVVAATRKAIDLTARLTTFARREASRREVVHVDELVRAILPLVRRLAPSSIDIITDLRVGPPVLLDAVEFEQVIVNLVVNAVDAMPSGGRLTIETQRVDLDVSASAMHPSQGPGPRALVVVSDTGAGMDEATRHRIFEPFYTTKGVGEGTGLGLSMVFAAVERAQGTIWVYSEPGHGSTFKIYLPPSADLVTPPDAERPTSEGSVGGRESILVVEDDEQVRDLVERGLREYGYDVTAAALPSEALRLAAERRFDVLVTDVVMPEMTGDAVAQRLRNSQPTLPAVYMSGYTANVLTFDLGPRDTLVGKPLTPRSLARAVREALDRDTIPS